MSQCCLTSGRYRCSLIVDKSVATFIKIPPGGEQKPKFWSIFRKLADAKDEATTMDDVVKKDFIHNPLYLSHGDGRGGALIAQKSRGEKRSEKIYRLDQQQGAISQTELKGEVIANAPKAGVASAMTKLWWANLREMTDIREGEEEQTAFQQSAPDAQVYKLPLNEPGKDSVPHDNEIGHGSSSIVRSRQEDEDESSQYQSSDGDHLEIAVSATKSVFDNDTIVVGNLTRDKTRLENSSGADEIEDAPQEIDSIDATLDYSYFPIKVEDVEVQELQSSELCDANRVDSNSAINITVNSIVTNSSVEPLLIEVKKIAVLHTLATPLTKTVAQSPVEEISKFLSSGHVSVMDCVIIPFFLIFFLFLISKPLRSSGQSLTIC